MKSRILVLALCFAAILPIVGCNTWEKNTYAALAADKAVLDEAQVDYEARTLPHTACVHDVITSAKQVHDTAVTGFKDYAVAKAAGLDVTGLQAAETADIANLVVFVTKVTALKDINLTSCK